MNEKIAMMAEKLHNEAMNLASNSDMEMNSMVSLRLMRRATQLETRAANLLPPKEDCEPSRGILYRSAASMALEVGDYHLAKVLIIHALLGSPDIRTYHELLQMEVWDEKTYKSTNS